MKLQAIRDVLSFQAFSPDPDDSNAPISRRLKGKRYVIINVSRAHVSWRSVDRKGNFDRSGRMNGEFLDVLGQMGQEWLGMTDGGWVVLSLNNRFVITQESNLSRKPDAEKIIRTNPKSIIGAKFDRGRRYALYHHPETSASLLLACEDAMVGTFEDAMAKQGLKPVRICCGLFAMVEDYLRRMHATGQDGRKDFVLLACCDGSACVLACKNGQWSELRSRSALYGDGDLAPIANLVAPVLNGVSEGTGIVLLHDEKDSDSAKALVEQLASSGAVDVTQPDHLWSVIGRN
jgi:hypothetical protein